MHWIYLITAGFFEIGWPLGLKLAATPSFKILGPIISIASMAVSGILLWLSLKGIPIGTAYAVWTGIGAVGTFIIGVVFFNDPSILLRWIGVSLIVLGVIFLKTA
ncbi:MAG: multidrug efflux SMR transporter [Candidatus Fonsibacter sp.]|nr:multidrug efflux SMR transporter [Candidatus Fonsibacter sp.]